MLHCLPPDDLWNVVRHLDFDTYLSLRTVVRTVHTDFIRCRFVYGLLDRGDRRALRLAVYYRLPEGVVRYYIRGRHDLIVAWRWYTLLCARVFGIQPAVDAKTWRGLGEYTESATMALGFGCCPLTACSLTWELLADHHWIPCSPWPAVVQVYFALPTSSTRLRFLQGLTRCLETRLTANYTRHPEHYDTIFEQLEWLANLHPPYRMGTLIHLLPHGGPNMTRVVRASYVIDVPEAWDWMPAYLGELPPHLLGWIPGHLQEVLVSTVRRLIVQIYQRAAIQLQYEDTICDDGYHRLKRYMREREWLWPMVGDSLNACRRGANYVDMFWSRLVE